MIFSVSLLKFVFCIFSLLTAVFSLFNALNLISNYICTFYNIYNVNPTYNVNPFILLCLFLFLFLLFSGNFETSIKKKGGSETGDGSETQNHLLSPNHPLPNRPCLLNVTGFRTVCPGFLDFGLFFIGSISRRLQTGAYPDCLQY